MDLEYLGYCPACSVAAQLVFDALGRGLEEEAGGSKIPPIHLRQPDNKLMDKSLD